MAVAMKMLSGHELSRPNTRTAAVVLSASEYLYCAISTAACTSASAAACALAPCASQALSGAVVVHA